MVQLLSLIGTCMAIVAASSAAPTSGCAVPKPPPPVGGPPGPGYGPPGPGSGPPGSGSGPPGHSNGGIPKPKEFRDIENKYRERLLATLPSGKCTARSIGKRRSWDEIDDATRRDYIRAVKCLAEKPSRTDKKLAPGAVNRLDDFTYIHINQTNIIHGTGYLLPWHRMFLWQFEEAMRNECGYKDYLPYWDNARFSEEPTKSAMWSGSDTGFGGNGIDLHLKDKELVFPGLAIPFHLPMPGGTGGGCITDGPFIDFKISLGPVVKTTLDPNNTYGYQPNPRCLSRNFDPASSIGLLTWANATKIISSPNIAALRGNVEQLWHKNSHTFIGGEGADPFSTTNDPAFYLLHAQIDRLWGIWQAQDLKEREYAIDGNRTFLGIPLDYAPHVPASLATIEDKMDMGLGFKPKTKMGMPMTKGGLCYIYE